MLETNYDVLQATLSGNEICSMPNYYLPYKIQKNVTKSDFPIAQRKLTFEIYKFIML